MPICKKCKKRFPNRMFIEGKIRILCKRKYCIICSPFGKHNTRYPEESMMGKMVTCKNCGRKYLYDRRKNHRRETCNSCASNKYRFEKKKKAVEYKGGKCEICGYDKSIRALDFHHKIKEEKDFTISGQHALTWEKIKKELDKCKLLCANCHREEHEKITNSKMIKPIGNIF